MNLSATYWTLIRSGFKVTQIAAWYGVPERDVIEGADAWGTHVQKLIFEFTKTKER
ncbi:MAG: hypothetical protein NDI61_09220 [Bdellovibrionaceae bacterium]|nr:hypothetical protein [Pseudobdellovibrionaceae bacterium]